MLELVAGAALRSLLLATAVGMGLRLRRRSGPHVALAAWTLVLVASLLMPVAMRLTDIALPKAIIAVGQPPFVPELLARIEASTATPRAQPILPGALALAAKARWRALASGLYLGVFSALMLRLLLGLALSWRIVRAATPVHADWAAGIDVRTSQRVNAPATFGSVILLPGDHAEWTPARRLAVLAHEGAHVVRRDFAIQLAAAIHQTVFWFTPFSWWLRRHLSDLAEAASDDAAIARLNDRVGYAEILLEISGRISRLPGAVAMARRAAIGPRIERILSETGLPEGISRPTRAMLVAGIFPFAIALALLTVLPAPVPRHVLSARSPAAADIVADEGLAESVPHPVASPAPAMVAAAIAPPAAPARSTDVASPPAPLAMPPATLAMAPPIMAPLERRPRAAERDAPPPPPHLMIKKTATAPSPGANRQPVRVASDQPAADRSRQPTAVKPMGSANRPNPMGGESVQSPLFRRLLNETCWGTYSVGATAGILPRRPYPVQAHFYRGPGDAPRVMLYSMAMKPADLPVTISGSEIKFTNPVGAIYTLSPSRYMLSAGYHRLTGSAEQPPGGTVDIACGESNRHL